MFSLLGSNIYLGYRVNAGVVITNKVAMLVHHAICLTMHLSSYEIIFIIQNVH